MTLRYAWIDKALWAAAFSIFLVLADLISFIHPIGQLNITPWNPPAAFEVLFLMLFGLSWMPWVYVTLFISDWVVRGTTFTALMTLPVTLGNGLLVVCYALIALMLRRLLLGQSAMSERGEIVRLSIIVACGAALTSLLYISFMWSMHALLTVAYVDALYRFFIGDLLGMMVLLPLAFLLLDARRTSALRAMFRSRSFWALLALLSLCLGLIVSLPLDDRLKYSFPLFFAVGLMAATHALPGATVACLLVQLLLVLSASHIPDNLEFLLDVQMEILTLNMTGLVIGTVVDERRRAEEQLRDSLQLIAAGELAGALAHELHQPLSALNAYAESALMLAATPAVPGSPDAGLLQRTLRLIADESVRAAEVARGLRRFFISGASNLQQVDAVALVQTCVQRLQVLADRREVRLVVDLPRLPNLHVDPVQIGTALTNLIRNALEASRAGQTVAVRARVVDASSVQLQVCDEADPLNAAQVQDVFRPFFSGKKHGLGLGLSISRSLVENNGGSLMYENHPTKCFVMNLPTGAFADV